MHYSPSALDPPVLEELYVPFEQLHGQDIPVVSHQQNLIEISLSYHMVNSSPFFPLGSLGGGGVQTSAILGK